MLLSEIENKLPKIDTSDYRSLNRKLFSELKKTCFVIDDDPTGNQTVYNIPLLTDWDFETIKKELKNETPICFILTNSRSLTEEKAGEIYFEATQNIVKASKEIGRDYTIISRGDSTLRGHFPVEIDSIQKAQGKKESIQFLIPMMFEGGRMTVNDIHYIKEGEKLVPVNDSPFAKDHTFGYSKADLKEWIQEKTANKVDSEDIISISLKEIRSTTIENLSKKIISIPNEKYCVVNALCYQDLDKVCTGLLLAEKQEKIINYRTSSSFVPSYIGQKPQPLLEASKIIDIKSNNGGLVIVGSYVPKTSSQLSYYLENNSNGISIELEISKFFGENTSTYIREVSNAIDKNISAGKDVIVYTSRKLKTGISIQETIAIASTISDSVIEIVKKIESTPKFLIAKGGITSHDIALKGLGMKRSKVIGQVLPGIPVWRMNSETKFPELPYVVFPGNVGDQTTLNTLINKISQS